MGAAEGRHSPRRFLTRDRLLSVAPTLTPNAGNERTPSGGPLD